VSRPAEWPPPGGGAARPPPPPGGAGWPPPPPRPRPPGYIGSSKALSYTVIGDVANTSARLCSIALAGQIVISESTLAKLGARFEFEELQAAKVKGKEKAIRVFNVLRERPLISVPAQIFVSEPTAAT